MQLSLEQMSIIFNGILAFLCIIMLVFIVGIIFKYSLSGICDLYFDKKTRIDEYKKGYEDGLREGLSIANELMDEFMEEHQEKMNRLLFNEEEEL